MGEAFSLGITKESTISHLALSTCGQIFHDPAAFRPCTVACGVCNRLKPELFIGGGRESSVGRQMRGGSYILGTCAL